MAAKNDLKQHLHINLGSFKSPRILQKELNISSCSDIKCVLFIKQNIFKTNIHVYFSTFSFKHTVKLLNKGHPFCRAFVATIEGWPLLRGFI